MPVIRKKRLTRACVRFWTEDYEILSQVARTSGEVCLNNLIRTVVHTYVTQLKARESVLSPQDAFSESLRAMGIPEPDGAIDIDIEV